MNRFPQADRRRGWGQVKRPCGEIYPCVQKGKKIPSDNKAPEVDCGQVVVGFETPAKEPGLPLSVKRLPLKLLRWGWVCSEQGTWKSAEGRDES